jgi:CelD/BcsL family acetyltransferase involved in cellulose biosynthesis
MKVAVVSANELSPENISAWVNLQTQDVTSDSPYFRPEFTQALGRVRTDVEVGVVEQEGQPVGFFPFQRRHGNVGWPVGGPLADFNGPIMRAGLPLDARELVQSCGLSAWHFGCLVAAKANFRPYFWFLDGSPFIDTSRGFDAYCADRRQAGSKVIRRTFQKLRKLERDEGDVRIEFNVTDERVLDQLIEWKAAQCRKLKVFNAFSPDWTRRLLNDLLEKNDINFSGEMCALYVKDELQAGFFCLRSNHVLHLWIAAFGPELSRYSPGYQRLIKIIQAAPSYGITRIDLGPGNEQFKRSFGNGAITLAEGSIDSRIMTRTARRLWHSSRHWVSHSRLRRPVLPAWRLVRRARDKVNFR